MKYPYSLLLLILITSIISVKGQINERTKYQQSSPNITTDTCQIPTFQEMIRDGNGMMSCSDLKVTFDNGYIITGRHNIIPTFINCAYLIKLNRFGGITWQKRIMMNDDANFHVNPRRVVLTPDSGYAVFADYLDQYAGGNTLLKFDKDGNFLWQKRYLPSGVGEYLMDFIATSDNGLAFMATAGHAFIVYKLDPSGNVVWKKGYATLEGRQMGFGMAEFNNSICVAGFGDSYYTSEKYNMLIRLDKSNGDIIWCKNFKPPGDPADVRFYRVSKSNNKIMVNGVFGMASSSTAVSQGLFQFSEDGTLERSVKIQNPGNSISLGYPEGPAFDDEGSVGAHSLQGDTSDVYLFKLDALNQVSWQRQYQLPRGQGIVKIKKTNDGGYVGAGPQYAYGYETGLHIYKTDTVGITGDCINRDPGLIATTVMLDTISRSLSVSNIGLDIFNAPDFYIGDANFIVEKLCSSNTECSNISLTGEKFICKKDSVYTYALSRDTSCHQPMSYSVSNASIAQIVGQTDSSVLIRYSNNGTVTIFASLDYACSNISNSISVHIFNNPDSLEIGADLNLCSNGFYELNAHSGYRSYLWQNGSTDSTFKVYNPGIYFVQVTDSCGNISADTVTAILAPPEFLDIGNDTTICRKDSVILNATPGFILYNWTPVYNITNINTASTQVYPYLDTLYRLSATKRPGCTVLDSVRIKLYPTPLIQLGNDTGICISTSLVLNAGPGFRNYLWNTGATSQQITVSERGEYSIQAVDEFGCYSVDTFKILAVNPSPVINVKTDTSICIDKTLTLDAGQGFDSYLWSTGEVTQKIIVYNGGLFWISVTDQNKCEARGNINVKEINCSKSIYFPNSFTPDNNGLNDIFKPKVYGVLNRYQLSVFNRYGQLVFYTEDVSNGWDGSFKNKIQQTGAFTWVAKFAFTGMMAETQIGSVLLLR